MEKGFWLVLCWRAYVVGGGEAFGEGGRGREVLHHHPTLPLPMWLIAMWRSWRRERGGWSWKRFWCFFRLRKTLPSNTFCLFPVHSSLECWLVGLQTWWQLVSVPNWSKNILVLIGWNNIGRDQNGQIWQTPLGSGWGKAELGRELSRSLNLKSTGLVVGGHTGAISRVGDTRA